MTILLAFITFVLLYFLFQKREEHWLIFGKDHTLEKFHKGGRTIINEKTTYGSSQETD